MAIPHRTTVRNMPNKDQLIQQVEAVLEKWHDKDGGGHKESDDK